MAAPKSAPAVLAVVRRSGARPAAPHVPLEIPFGPQVAEIASGWSVGVSKLFAAVDVRAGLHGLDGTLDELRAALKYVGALPGAAMEALHRAAHDPDGPETWRRTAATVLDALRPLPPKRAGR